MGRSRAEKICKLRAMTRERGGGASENEAAFAAALAAKLEAKTVTAKQLAHAVRDLLRARGLTVRVKHRERENDWHDAASYEYKNGRVNAEVRCASELPQEPCLHRDPLSRPETITPYLCLTAV
jgi:hypothetical protein